MRKIAVMFFVVLLAGALSGCGGQKQTETDLPNGMPDVSVSVGTDIGTKLPNKYPSDKFPIYEGSYVSGVIEADGSYTVLAFSKDDSVKVAAFYEQVLQGAAVTFDTKTEESLTSFGTKDGYGYNLDVGRSSEIDGYQTSITILIHPLK